MPPLLMELEQKKEGRLEPAGPLEQALLYWLRKMLAQSATSSLNWQNHLDSMTEVARRNQKGSERLVLQWHEN